MPSSSEKRFDWRNLAMQDPSNIFTTSIDIAIASAGVLCAIAPVLRNNTVAGIVFATAAGLGFVAAPGIWATVIDITRRGPGILGGFLTGAGNVGGNLRENRHR